MKRSNKIINMSESKKYLDFEVIKEKWNKYSLKDGSNLKTRLILKSVWYTIQDDKKNYAFDIHQITTMMCDSTLQGQKNQTKYSKEKINSSIEVRNCPYDTIAYEINEYLLDDSTKIQIHSNLSNLARTSLFGSNGDRIYNVNLDMSMMINVQQP